MQMRTKFLLTSAAILLLFVAFPAAAAWPTQAQWIPTLGVDWSYVTDPVSDVTPRGHLDLVPDQTSSSAAAAYWYFDGTYLFFRMIVDGDPVKNRGLASAEMLSFGWNVLIESTGDNYPDYAASVDGTGSSDTFHTLYNTGLDVNVESETGYSSVAAPNSSYVDAEGFQILMNGYVRSRQVTTDPTKFYNSNPDFYIDFMVPLSWLSRAGGATPPPPITTSTPIKFAFGTGASGQTIKKDLAGQSATTDIVDFFNDSPATSIGTAGYGVLRDKRHAASPPAMGIWQPGETVVVNGFGWPVSTSSYYRNFLNVRILDPLTHIVWSGNVPCAADGSVADSNTLNVTPSLMPGIYYIVVEDPRSLGTFNPKDTFTIPAPPVDLTTSSKSVDKAQAVGGDILLYTITVRNTGSGTANGIIVSDTPSIHTQYVAGSTTAAGTPLGDLAGVSPLYNGFVMPPLGLGATYVITFRAMVKPETPDQTVAVNLAVLSYASAAYPLEAFTLVNAPAMTIVKSVEPAGGVLPGGTLTYTVSFANAGHSAAADLEIIDFVPGQTSFVRGSATASLAGGSFSYRYIPGGPFEASDSLPGEVIEIRYVLPTLPTGTSGTIAFSVTVK